MERKVWLVRPPKQGAFDERALEDAIITGEFGVREDLSDHDSFEQILSEVEEANPREKPGRIENQAKQLEALLHGMQPGDLVLHPHDGRRAIAIGILRPGIVQDADGRPSREVEWLRSGIAKTDLHADFHHSLSAGNQISEISRNNTLRRVEAMVAEGKDPGPSGSNTSTARLDPSEIIPLLEQRLLDQVGAAFAGHDLAALVAALLECDGYAVDVAPPGPDGGCDLTIGRGGLGLDGPTYAGQVKSGDIVVDDMTLKALIGVMSAMGADRGFIASWSGVTKPVARQLQDMRLKIVFWDGHEICRRLVSSYDKMPLWVRDRVKVRMVPVLDLA